MDNQIGYLANASGGYPGLRIAGGDYNDVLLLFKYSGGSQIEGGLGWTQVGAYYHLILGGPGGTAWKCSALLAQDVVHYGYPWDGVAGELALAYDQAFGHRTLMFCTGGANWWYFPSSDRVLL
jgi:hypothetical protein